MLASSPASGLMFIPTPPAAGTISGSLLTVSSQVFPHNMVLFNY